MGDNRGLTDLEINVYRDKVRKLHDQGSTMAEISKEVGMSKHFVSKIVSAHLLERCSKKSSLIDIAKKTEDELFLTIELERRNPSPAIKKRISKLSVFYSNFVAI